jgi:hypothetical protein
MVQVRQSLVGLVLGNQVKLGNELLNIQNLVKIKVLPLRLIQYNRLGVVSSTENT